MLADFSELVANPSKRARSPFTPLVRATPILPKFPFNGRNDIKHSNDERRSPACYTSPKVSKLKQAPWLISELSVNSKKNCKKGDD